MILYDSETPADIPANAQAVAGYGPDGQEGSWGPADWTRFPQARLAVISRTAYIPRPIYPGGAVIFDVERGALQISDLPEVVPESRAQGDDPTVYVQASNWGAAVAECTAARVAPPLWWVASWGSAPVPPPGAVAVQYAKGTPEANYDTSATVDSWPPAPVASVTGVNEPPAPLPGDALTTTLRATPSGKGYYIVGQDGGVFMFGDAVECPLNGVAGAGGSLPGCKITPSGPVLGFDLYVVDGKVLGYWMMDAIGGVYTFGQAEFLGSLPGIHVTP